MVRLAAVLALLLVNPAVARSQNAPAPGDGAAPALRPMAQINPLGFLQFGPNLEVEFPVSPMVSVTPGVRLVSLGLASHLVADAGSGTSLGFTWMLGGTVRVYPQAQALRGFYIGPRLEYGMGSSEDDTDSFDSTYLAVAADGGYRWMYPSGFGLSLGLQSGMLRENWTGSDGSEGDTTFAFGMLVFGIGLTL